MRTKIKFAFMVGVLMISTNLFAKPKDSKVIKIAKDVITAYKNKDPKLLKKHASGILKYSISDAYFKDKKLKDIVKSAENWNGKIYGVRYRSSNIMGKTVLMATIQYSDVYKNKKGIKMINVVDLSSFNNSPWKAFGAGLDEMKKSEYDSLSKEIKTGISAQKTSVPKIDHKDFSIEMADGTTIKNPGTDKLKKLLGTLNDDNFFLTLSNKSGFIQTSYSKKGYTAEYKNNEGQFEAQKLLSLDEIISLFVSYLNKDANWKGNIKWAKAK